MTVSAQIARQLRAVYAGGNWTGVALKETLEGLNWQQSTQKVSGFNTIALLLFHMNYYVGALLNVLKGTPLNASDKYSFDLPPVTSQADWEQLVRKAFADAEQVAQLIEQLPDSRLEEIFVVEKYGTYFRNLTGLIEHTHYHLGQIVLIKKLISQQEPHS